MDIDKHNEILIDTNILLRFLLKDNVSQYKIAFRIFKQIEDLQIIGYINILVIHETIYVLRYVYNISRKDIANSLRKLSQLRNLEILDITSVQFLQALDLYQTNNIDFPDIIYHIISLDMKLPIATFDRDFTKLKSNLVDLKD